MRRLILAGTILFALASPAGTSFAEVAAAGDRGGHGADLNDLPRFAERGDADAPYKLGLMYANGRGVPRDQAKAYFWYSMAIASGTRNADVAMLRNLAAQQLTKRQVDAILDIVRKRWPAAAPSVAHPDNEDGRVTP